MTKVQTVTCQECGWKGTVAHCEPIAPRYLPERVAVRATSCPRANALNAARTPCSTSSASAWATCAPRWKP